MTAQNNAEKETHSFTNKPDAMLGAGRLTAGVWKKRSDEIDFDFNVFRINRTTGAVSQQFQSGDLADLARLAQLLAAEMSQDEALGLETCDDLACLAACLEDVLPTGYVFPGIRCREDGPAARTISSLLTYLWEDEGKHFMANPSESHIYRQLVAVDVWLRGVGPTFGVELAPMTPDMIEDKCGVCPVCGSNDGGLELSDSFWFHCRKHQVRWRAWGVLCLLGLDEDPQDAVENFQKIGSFREVYPMLNPEIRVECD